MSSKGRSKPEIQERADPALLECCHCRSKRNLPRPIREERDPKRKTASYIYSSIRDKAKCECGHKICENCKLLDRRKQEIKYMGGGNLLPGRLEACGWRCLQDGCNNVNDVDMTQEVGDWDLLCSATRHEGKPPVWFDGLWPVVNMYNEDLGSLNAARLKITDGPIKDHLRRYAKEEGKKKVEDDQGTPYEPLAYGIKADTRYTQVLRESTESLCYFILKMDAAWKSFMQRTTEQTVAPPLKAPKPSFQSVRQGTDPNDKSNATYSGPLPRGAKKSPGSREKSTSLTPSDTTRSGVVPTASSHTTYEAYRSAYQASGYPEDEEGMYDHDLAEPSEPTFDTPTNYETPLTSYSHESSTYHTAGPSQYGMSYTQQREYDLGEFGSQELDMTDADPAGGYQGGEYHEQSGQYTASQWGLQDTTSPGQVLQEFFDEHGAMQYDPTAGYGDMSGSGGGGSTGKSKGKGKATDKSGKEKSKGKEKKGSKK
jgi:hypothetical protein